jgi:ATP-dependent Clp protease ATP-binding subunit ClpX
MDVGGEEVQQALLKIIEGTVVRVPMESKRKNPNGGIVEIDSKNILFICGGAFVGLEKIIEERRNKKNIGFINNTTEKVNLYTGVTNKDLTTFGLIPEFVGRFSSIVSLSKLSVSDLVKILKHTKNSLIKQYQYLFELDNIKLEFDTDSLELIAEKAIELNTNARGLKNIIEKILLPYQYAAADLVEKGLTKIIINKLAVNGETATLIFDRKKNETIQK